MTRVNLVDPTVLIDQHLIAEYREIVRVVNSHKNYKGDYSDCPKSFVLGKGHVKFFYPIIEYIYWRHSRLIEEMERRGFTANMSIGDAECTWQPSKAEVERSRSRIRERLFDMRPEPRYNGIVMTREAAARLLNE